MKTLIFLFALVAVATCDCGALQRLKVKEQWAVAFGTAHRRVDFGTAIWRGMFRQSPKAKELFKRVNGDHIKSGMFVAHSQRVLTGLNMLISTLDNAENLKLCMSHLHDDHVDRHIPNNYFQLMKNSLMKVIPAAIGRCFDEEAWSDCLDVIVGGITEA